MISFQAFLLLALCITCVLSLPVPANATSSASDEESPLTIPFEVLNQLTDITQHSNGLLPLWRSATHLANNRILISEYQQPERKTCRGLVFNEISTETVSCENITSLTHTELASYYNEFVIQLKVSETILLNHIEKEIQEEHRTEAEEEMQQIIYLLDKKILPLLALVLNMTSSDVNCSDTQEMVNNMITLYSDCAAVQTANIYLAQATLDLNSILNNILKLSNGDDDVDELDMTAFNDREWCIL